MFLATATANSLFVPTTKLSIVNLLFNPVEIVGLKLLAGTVIFSTVLTRFCSSSRLTSRDFFTLVVLLITT